MEDRFEYQVYNTDRAEQIAGIEGLTELMKALNERNIYVKACHDYEEGLIDLRPAQPTVNVAEMKKKFPRAAAYLKANNWRMEAHPKKAALGEQAIIRLLNGEDAETVLEEINLAWAAFKVAQEG